MLVFKSKVDRWLAMSLVLALVMLVVNLPLMFRPDAKFPVSALLITVLGSALIIWILVSTRYSLQADRLLVSSGPVRKTIMLAAITKLEKTRNPLASPALSLDRLAIYYDNGKWVMISPADQQGFLQALRERGVDAAAI